MGILVNVNAPANTLAGVLVGPAALMPSDWVLRRGYEGAQIIIEWGDAFEPASVLSQRLVRRRFGFPEDENDGEIIFNGPTGANKISDLTAQECFCYFYKMFVFALNGDILISNATQGEIIPLETGFFGPKMFDLKPELYKLNDKGLDSAISPKLALTEGAAAGDVEVYNFGEDGTVFRGPLQRMLRVFGPALDEGKGLIDCFPAQIDVDTSCLAELEGIAALLGLSLNKELSPEKFRNEVRVQVDNLKLKGTIPGLKNRLRSVSGLDAIITEQCNRVLISNDPDRLSLGFTPSELCNINGPDDEIFRAVGFYEGTTPFWLWFNVYMDIDLMTFLLEEPLARKWCIAIEESSPTCHRGFLYIRTGLEPDTIGIALAEETEDILALNDGDTILILIVESFDDEQVAVPASWMLFNDVTKLTNTPDYTAVFATPTLP